MNQSIDILSLFDSIASKYDILNNVISFGRHKFVKRHAVKNVPLKKGARILDLCTGTGDIAILLSEHLDGQTEITAVDFSENMLGLARSRASKHQNIKFLQADVLDLPFEANYFDAVFISFGLRNLKDLDKGIEEMQRVVKPGGYVSNLDTGKPRGLVGLVFNFYFFKIVPMLGNLISKNFVAYKYLPESTKKFPSQYELVDIFKKAGFKEARNFNFAFGAMAQQIAKK